MGCVIFWIIFWIVTALAACLPAYFISMFIIGLLFVNMKKEYEHDSKFFRFLLNSSTSIAVRLLRIHIKVTGRELLPKGRFLLICNHRSKFDPILTWHILSRENLAFISKPENFKIPVFGRIIHRCCFMPIDRENPRSAMKTVNRAANLIKNDVASVAVYPEGTRNYGEGLLPFHTAVFKIAQKANVPIVIMSIWGTPDIRHNFPKHKSNVEINILGVLSAEEITTMKTNEIGNIAAKKILSDQKGNKA